ncbi:trace amine-associated receptor 1-like [Erpetoichthys calabaricus]|uniref:trace amine-associated receptor 1-like n=1 Tax=Erpetoichthys calabaricus TaxID=27687 RepID=UPI0010A0B7E7|nr:trace amine-associated receptor 1-like [Erpetoichthys calabaricus]
MGYMHKLFRIPHQPAAAVLTLIAKWTSYGIFHPVTSTCAQTYGDIQKTDYDIKEEAAESYDTLKAEVKNYGVPENQQARLYRECRFDPEWPSHPQAYDIWGKAGCWRRPDITNRMNFNLSKTSQTVYYCYPSVNNSCRRQVLPLQSHILLYTVLWATVVFTVFGNLLVIITIAHFKQLHTPTNCLVLSLAVTDLLVGGFVMPPITVQLVETCWYLGDAFCKFYLSTVIMLCTASVIHLSFISIDRYYAICYPLRYQAKITVSVTLNLILFSWILSAVLGYGIVYLELNLKGIEEFYYQNVKCAGSCVLLQNEASGLVSSLFTFYLPGFVMICIYLKIFSVAQRQARSITDTVLQNQSAEEKRNAASRTRERKAAKTLAIVMGVFLLCWAPFFVCNIINPVLNHPAPQILIETLAFFGYMNSTFNPLVYGFFYSWFRKALKLIANGKIFQNDSSRTKLYND